MSEQNILNPAVTSPLNPDYAIKITDPQVVSRWQARSGKPFFRRLAARGEVFEMTWGKRMFADYLTLLQWVRQYENDYFSFIDWDHSGRYYTGMFADQPTFTREANNQVTITAQFVVVPTLPLFQYPSNWGVDSIFLEEAAGYGDLVKLTGNWDRRDKNYVVGSETFDLAPWQDVNGATVTANQALDPNGVSQTADQINFPSRAANSFVGLAQNPFPPFVVPNMKFTFSVWARVTSGTATVEIIVQDNPFVAFSQGTTCNLTTSWQQFFVTATAPSNSSNGLQVQIRAPFASATSAFSILVDWAQLEYGAAPSAYTSTQPAPVQLKTPTPDASLHGGFGYFDIGTTTTDAAEWLYFGYGFRVWAPKYPYAGIMQVFLDNASQGTIDLYAAAVTNSAPLMTAQSVAMGFHRVKLSPTNTKNAASSNFIVVADAIEVMR